MRGQHSVHQTAEAKAFRHHTMDICAALRSRRKKKKNRKIKRNSQKEFQFDSITAYRYTLGYPGEGPEKLKMATFLVRGLKGKDDGGKII